MCSCNIKNKFQKYFCFKSNFVAIYFLLGTNVTEAKKVLAESGLPILTANNLDEAARKVVISVNT